MLRMCMRFFMKLTFGMAWLGDWGGLHETVQALRVYHRDVMNDVEIVCVCNDPNQESLNAVAGRTYRACE